MSERKQTPDVLADLLSVAPAPEAATAAPAPAAPGTARKPAKRKATQPAPAQPKSTPAPAALPAPAAPPQWEYREVVFREFRGWRPRQVDGREQSNWKEAPVIFDYLRQAGDDGWELVSLGEERNYQKTAYLKRPKAP